MKRELVLGAAAAMALLLLSPGGSTAGDRMNRSASPDPGTWEYWLAEETGNLPGPETGTHHRKEPGDTSSAEFGTWEYWLAEETGNLPGSEPGSHPYRNDVSRGKEEPVSGHDSWEYWIGG